LERCNAFVKIKSEREEHTKAPAQVANLTAKWPESGEIEFKDYVVRYREKLPTVLKGVTLKINSNEKIGIVGRTGSGKSTMFLAILRIVEGEAGAIYIDGVDISKLGLYDLRQKITIIPQDPMLFKGTIRENLDLQDEFKEHEIWDVLEKICMKEKFEKDKGLKSELNDGGENLSAGEKQLICIGRAILKKSKILLIDEATSNIDMKTEKLITDTIREKLADCTVLTIAHRLKTIINSDRVLVMHDGVVAEFDTPDNLLKNNATMFHALWNEFLQQNPAEDS
jgi:ABC-type multidrug transport system fused ATPase/permease subunit